MLMLLPAVARTPWEQFLAAVPFLVFVVVWFLLPIFIGAKVGQANNRGGESFLLPFFLGWIGVIILMLLPKRKSRDELREEREARAAAHKTCPDCAEEVKVAARKCKHCGYEWPE